MCLSYVAVGMQVTLAQARFLVADAGSSEYQQQQQRQHCSCKFASMVSAFVIIDDLLTLSSMNSSTAAAISAQPVVITHERDNSQ